MPDIGALAAGGIALIAAGVWVASWLAPIPDEEVAKVEATSPPYKPSGDKRVDTTAAEVPPPPAVISQTAPPPAAPRAPPAEPAPAAAPMPKAPPRPAEEIVAAPPPVQAAKRVSPGTDNALAAMRGRYTGNFVDSASSEFIGLTLVISSVDDGVVKGTATLGGRDCDGNYPMQGTFRNGQLDLRAPRNGGPAGDCPLSLSLSAQGGRLIGAMGNGSKVQLSK